VSKRGYYFQKISLNWGIKKMALFFRLLLFIFFLVSSPKLIMANGIKHNHNSETISEIRKKVDFTILTPRKIPDDWTLEIKTSPWISLHYMGSNHKKMMVGITLRRGFPISDEDYPHSKIVDINGRKGYYQEWAEGGQVDKNDEPLSGGILNWVQDGTFIEMISFSLSKEKMLEVARSMK
jgi:hypothetical protein